MTDHAWKKRYQCEHQARLKAESFLEKKSRDLYTSNLQLNALNISLEQRVNNRIAELEKANARSYQEIAIRRQAEQDLQMTQFMVDRSADSIFWINPKGNFEYVNESACLLLGFTNDELLEMSIYDIDLSISKDSWKKYWQMLKTYGANVDEATHRSKSGLKIPVEVTANYITANKTEFIGIFVRDVTERVETRKREKNRNALHSIVDHLSQVLMKQDDLNQAINCFLSETGVFLGVSRSMLVRLREGNQMVFNTHEWCAPDVPSQIERYLDIPISEFGYWIEQLELGQPVVVDDFNKKEIPQRAAKVMQEQKVRALLALPVIINGELQSIIGFEQLDVARKWFNEEVTLLQILSESFARIIERRIADREREANRAKIAASLKREKTANQAKSMFLANMSHEIRTPMTAIVGYADMINRPDRSSEEYSQWASHIRRNAEHLLALINDVLDLSKIEAGQLTIQPETTSLIQVVQDMKKLFEPVAKEKLITFDVMLDEAIPKKIQTDPTRIRQILINLINNAIKFTIEGRVTLEIKMICTETPSTEYLSFAVRDTGIGIAPEKLNEVFKPFNQVHNVKQINVGGTGMGLTICRCLAELLGGNLKVRSKTGLGSCFTFDLPINSTNMTEDTASNSSYEIDHLNKTPDLHGIHVLVVDDNPDNRSIIQFLLEEAGATIMTANNGQASVKTVIEQPLTEAFDIILMDIQMPIMNGYEATAKLREHGYKLPIIALTAHAMSDDQQRCRDAGCDDYITKPIVPNVFFATLVRYIQSWKQNKSPQTKQVPIVILESTMADNASFTKLLKAYKHSLKQTHEELTIALKQCAWDIICKQAHRLHGTAANYGFITITEAASKCERFIRTDSDEKLIIKATEQLIHLLMRATVNASTPSSSETRKLKNAS